MHKAPLTLVAQEYKHMDNWLALVICTRDNIRAQVPLELHGSQSGHAACFRVLSEYMKSLNNVPVLHNFAAAIFHLSLALKVCWFYLIHALKLSKLIRAILQS
jgi:hypothetical protein